MGVGDRLMSFITPNLDLTVWDQDKDDFEHAKLADNWISLDEHNHTGEGKGLKLVTESFEPECVTSALIKFRNVGTNQIALRAVGAEQIKERGIESNNIALEAIINELIAKHTIEIQKLNPNVIPLGLVTYWYTPTPLSYTPPTGENTPWEICDGREWSKIKGNKMGEAEGELKTGNIPNLNERFIMGTIASGPKIGTTGGATSASLAHTHSINPHSHPVSSHQHAIGEAGAHRHRFGEGVPLHTRTNAFLHSLAFVNTEGHIDENGEQSLYVPGSVPLSGFDRELDMTYTGEHTHGGGYTGETPATAENVSLNTNVALSTVSLTPLYENMLAIMRVR
jgi:hypothetical protein